MGSVIHPWIRSRRRSSGTVSLRLRFGRLMVQHSGVPLLSLGVGQHVPPSPGSEIRVQQHHRGNNNNPKLQPLLDWWDMVVEVGEGEGMTMRQGHGLRLRHDLSVCMESGENGEDVSPVGEWVMHLCQCVWVRWVLRLQLGACWM